MSFVYYVSLCDPTPEQLLSVIQELVSEFSKQECSWMLADNGVQFSVLGEDTVLTPEEYPTWAREVRGDSPKEIEEFLRVNQQAKELGISLFENGQICISNYRRVEIDIFRNQFGSSWQARGSCDFELLMVFLERLSRVIGNISVSGDGVENHVNVFPGANTDMLRTAWESCDAYNTESGLEA